MEYALCEINITRRIVMIRRTFREEITLLTTKNT